MERHGVAVSFRKFRAWNCWARTVSVCRVVARQSWLGRLRIGNVRWISGCQVGSWYGSNVTEKLGRGWGGMERSGASWTGRVRQSGQGMDGRKICACRVAVRFGSAVGSRLVEAYRCQDRQESARPSRSEVSRPGPASEGLGRRGEAVMLMHGVDRVGQDRTVLARLSGSAMDVQDSRRVICHGVERPSRQRSDRLGGIVVVRLSRRGRGLNGVESPGMSCPGIAVLSMLGILGKSWSVLLRQSWKGQSTMEWRDVSRSGGHGFPLRGLDRIGAGRRGRLGSVGRVRSGIGRSRCGCRGTEVLGWEGWAWDGAAVKVMRDLDVVLRSGMSCLGKEWFEWRK